MSFDKSHNLEAVLADLAVQIRAADKKSLEAFRKGTEYAIECGKVLVEAKLLCEANNKEWIKWINDNCRFKEDTAEDYMRLYRKTKDNPKLREQILQLGITAAKQHLRDLERSNDGDGSDKDRHRRGDVGDRSRAKKFSKLNAQIWSDLAEYLEALEDDLGEKALIEFAETELNADQQLFVGYFLTDGEGLGLPLPKVYRDLIEQSPEIELENLNLRSKAADRMEWYTPPYIVEAARTCLGAIDVDPASCDLAQQTVKAGKYFTKESDGLKQEWHGRVWLNPPYRSLVINNFVRKLLVEMNAGRTTEAIMLTNNQTDTEWFSKAKAASAAICFPKFRIKFWKPDGDTVKEAKDTPLQGQAIFYFGPNVEQFRGAFREFGSI
jgi:hypothetical protein